MLAAVPVDVPQSFGDYLIHQLHGLVQTNLSILDSDNGQQIADTAGNGGRGSAQIVGDSSEQIGPELLVAGQSGGFLFLPDVILQQGGQGTGQQGHHEHNGHGHQVVGVAEPEGEPGDGKEEVEHQHADHTGQQSAHRACGDY